MRTIWLWAQVAGAAATAALAAAAHSAAAQQLGDPMRPPPGFYTSSGGGVATGTGETGLVLQSVMISDTARSAIIDGEHVLMGGKIGGGRLINVSETEAVVQVGGARRTLRLYPGVDKRDTAALEGRRAGAQR